MSKAISYYDWELNFKKRENHSKSNLVNYASLSKKDRVNSLGMTNESYKDFMKKWKEKNL
jgi:hypothetical protein